MSERKEYKVYVIHDCDWIVAYDKKGAIEAWESTTGETYDDYEDDGEDRVREETRDLSTLEFMDDPYKEEPVKTQFDVKIKELLETGQETVPFFLASSEY